MARHLVSTQQEGSAMYYFINAFLVLAMVFFFVLPMTDRRTARMKLCVVCALAVALTISASAFRPYAPAPTMMSRG
jgi:hypothetical protein